MLVFMVFGSRMNKGKKVIPDLLSPSGSAPSHLEVRAYWVPYCSLRQVPFLAIK